MIESGELMDLVAAILAGAAGGLLLNLVYFGVQASWPENYSTIRNVIDEGARGSLIKYGLLRFLPTYITGVFTSVTLERLSIPVWPALASLLLVHLAFTNMRALTRLWRAPERSLRNPVLVIYHLGTTLLLCFTGALSGWSFSLWSSLIPAPTELTNALWTGAFAAVVAAATQRFVRFEPASTRELVSKARKDVGEELWREIPEIAQHNDCDPALIQAIVGAESLQRPRWIRSLERLKGRVFRAGSYGAGQMSSSVPLTDADSIDALCVSFSGYYPERSKHGWVLASRMKARVESHNDNPQFLRQVHDLYQELIPHPLAHSVALAADNRPVIEVTSIERVGQQISLQGTAIVYEGTIAVAAQPSSSSVPSYVTAHHGGPLRGDWSLLVPLVTRAIWLSEPAMEDEIGDGDQKRTAYVDLADL